MIRLQDTTPKVYYEQSRDFQYIGRLFDIVLNSVKTNADLLYTLPISDNSDKRLVDLMTLTLGFKSKHNYNVKQLSALCSAFASIIKNKGSITGISTAVNTLISAEGITQEFECEFLDNNTTIRIYLPMELTDTNLLKDLLVYILPAGMKYELIKSGIINLPKTITEGATEDSVKIYDNGTYDPNDSRIYDNNELVVIPQLESDTLDTLLDGIAADTKGIIANGSVYRPEDPENE